MSVSCRIVAGCRSQRAWRIDSSVSVTSCGVRAMTALVDSDLMSDTQSKTICLMSQEKINEPQRHREHRGQESKWHAFLCVFFSVFSVSLWFVYSSLFPANSSG